MLRFIIIIFGSILIFTGCANRDVAQEAYNEGNYQKAYNIWKRWVDAGYFKYDINLINSLNKMGRGQNLEEIKNMALKAYENGAKKAAFVLEDIYIRENNLKTAYEWMQKGDFNLSSLSDFNNHLFLITHYLKNFNEQKKYLEIFENLAEKGNIAAAYTLGKFYADPSNPFYDIRRSVYFYNIAYDGGNDLAGINLARIYLYQLNKEKEGLDILKKIYQRGNGEAAYEIANFLFKKLNNILKKENTPCIDSSFNSTQEFYLKKEILLTTDEMYLKKIIVPWYKKAYKLGYVNSMLKLINLDIEEGNFNKDYTFSGMNLKEAENFLLSLKNNIRAKLLLAKLYENYPQPDKLSQIESIYIDYMEQNATDAYWRLYKYYKKFKPDSPKINSYLEELKLLHFKPAEIEIAYNEILKGKNISQNIEILKKAANNNNLSAISYLFNLKKKGILKNLNPFIYLVKMCEITPINPHLDMKFADYYLNNNNLDKGATILQFYADIGNSNAQYRLSEVYQKICPLSVKRIYWLNKAKSTGNINAIIDYYSLVLNGIIEGDINTAVQILDKYAKAGNAKAAVNLADAYANGIGVKFDPKTAVEYYLLAIKNGDSNVILSLINLYNRINVNDKYDSVIESLYKKAIEYDVKSASIQYASYLIKKGKIKKAKRILLNTDLNKEPLARVLLYQITGNKSYLRVTHRLANVGVLLLQHAKDIAKNSKTKALLFAFRAYLCNTPASGKLIYNLMSYINDANVIKKIYEKAKSYPRCKNYTRSQQ